VYERQQKQCHQINVASHTNFVSDVTHLASRSSGIEKSDSELENLMCLTEQMYTTVKVSVYLVASPE
jgi:hypothetical protein